MRKKVFIVLLISMLQFHSVAHAGVWQLLVGMGLMGGGLFMAADGFSTVKKIDQEWDEKVIDREWQEIVKDQEWDFLYYEYHQDWTLAIWWAYVYPEPYPASVISSWWGEDYSGYPGDYNYYEWNHHVTYTTEYYVTYRNKHFVTYKTETKSPMGGAIGVAGMGLGTYLVIDYLIDLNKLKKKAGIEVKVVRKKDTTYLLCSKNF